MGSKAEYEARKAERNRLKDMNADIRNRTEQVMLLDMLDRFVTAVEDIAATMGPKTALSSTAQIERTDESQ